MSARTRAWLRSVFLRRRQEREMREEMTQHLERAAERLVARGMSPEAARREARREFGSVPFLEEQGRAARGARWVDTLVADVRFGLRHFHRTPLTTLTMFVVLAIGISISALLLSGLHSLAVQPPAGVVRSDALVRIRGRRGDDAQRARGITEDELRADRALRDQFALVAGSTAAGLPLVVPGGAERRVVDARVTFVTDDYFALLGVRPALGPGLPRAGDAASAPVAVINHATWTVLFGRDPRVIGSAVSLGGSPVTVVGVLPEKFGGTSMSRTTFMVWLPLAARAQLVPEPRPEFLVVARLQRGATPRSASAAANVVTRRLAATDDSLRALVPSTDVVPLLAMNGDPQFERELVRAVFLVGLLAVLVLLVVCTNVSALLMGLATARRQEIAIRVSLGAGRGRILGQLLTESMLLAAAAGATALGLVASLLPTMGRLAPDIPFELRIGWVPTLGTMGAALAVGILFGLAPALHGMRPRGGRGRLQRALVVAQVTFTQPLIALLAMVLVVVLGELRAPRQTELGDRLVSVQLNAPVLVPPETSPAAAVAWARQRAGMQRLIDRLRAIPGVEATVVDWKRSAPLGDYTVHPADRAPRGSPEPVRLDGRRAAPGYFAVLGTPIVHGRDFTGGEAIAAPPRPATAGILLGADLARRLWGGADPIGRRLVATSDSATGARTLTVVGVIDDPLARARRAGDAFRVYLPADTTWLPVSFLVRTTGRASAVVPAVRTAVRDEAAGMTSDVRTVAELQAGVEQDLSIAASVISTAGMTALLLSAIGLYAVIAFAVGQRTREIAVRMAIGARGPRIVRGFVADGVRLGAFGLMLGLPVSLVGLSALAASDSDFPSPPVIPVAAISALGVIATATLAAWLPARRAATVDPAVTLRAE